MDRFFGLDQPESKDGLSLLASFFDPVSVSIAEELLSESGIPHLKKERGAGGMVRLVTGFQSFGTDFFTRPEDAERAREAILPLLEANEESGEVTEQ